MFQQRRSPSTLLALVTMSVLALSACAQQQPAAPAAAPTSAPAAAAPTSAPAAAAPTTAPAAAATSAPAAGGKVQVPAQGESPTIDKIKKNGVFRAGVAVSAPDLLQDPGTKKYFGPAADVSDRIAKELGVKLEYVDTGWDVVMAGLQSDKFDVAMAPLFVTPKRKEVADFVSYTTAGTCYFMMKDAKFNTLADLNSPDALMTTFTGTGTEEGIKKSYPKATINSIVQPPGGAFAYDEVLSGRANVAPFDSPLAKVILKKYPQFKIIPGVDGKAGSSEQDADYCIANADIPFPVGMAYQKGDAKMGAFLQSVVDDMKTDIDANILKYSDPKYFE